MKFYALQHWTRLEKRSGEPWPEARYDHAAACVGYGGDHPQLLITGGYPTSDTWLLDLQTGRWREVSIKVCANLMKCREVTATVERPLNEGDLHVKVHIQVFNKESVELL